YFHHSVLPSFPTRRSSDLFKNVPDALNFDGDVVAAVDLGDTAAVVIGRAAELAQLSGRSLTLVSANPVTVGTRFPNPGQGALERSEEHTSELQSRFDLVCR